MAGEPIFFDECKMHPFVMRSITEAVNTIKQDQRDAKETRDHIERKIDRLDEKMDSQHDSTSGKITALEKAIIDFLAAQRGIEEGRASVKGEIRSAVRIGWKVLLWVSGAAATMAAGGGLLKILGG